MDRERFDALAKLVSLQQSRRSVLAMLLGALVLGQATTTTAKPKRNRGRQNPKRGESREKRGRDGQHEHAGKGSGVKNRKSKQRPRTHVEAVPGSCCSRNTCTPGPGKNLGKCCFEDADFAGQSFKGANLGQANFSRAILSNANFGSANLGKTCFVDADLTGARFPGANLGGAIFCRTRTANGEDNSGCDQGTICCPTCDDAHPCADGELCCAGRCIAGNCCDNGEQSTCGTGELCCDHICAEGVCCQAADCANETCQRRACENRQCAYTPVQGRPGPRCPAPRVCCQTVAGEPVCCLEGSTTCDAQGLCCTAQSRDTTCAVGTPAPKCGEITNNCGQQVDCGPCAVLTCQQGSCTGQGDTCVYEPVFGTEGPDCNTICCRDAQGTPECCGEGLTQCFPSGGCRCANNDDCPADAACCDGRCVAPVWANLTTFGSGPGDGDDQFDNPVGIAISGDEQTAWVVDQGNTRVSVWSRQPNGDWDNDTVFGLLGDGPGELAFPFGVAVSDNGLTALVGDQGNSRISVWTRQFDNSWSNPIRFGSAGDGESEFDRPTGVAVSGDGRTAWVADTGNTRVSVWTESNGFWTPQTTFGTGPGNGPGEFDDPVGVAVSADGQTAWVVDRITTHVSVWIRQSDGSWTFDTEFGSFGDGEDQFRGPLGVAVSGDGQTAWVADVGHNRISLWTRQPDGEWAHAENLGTGRGNGRSQFDGPSGVAVAADGRILWVSDSTNRRVSIWTSRGCPPQ